MYKFLLNFSLLIPFFLITSPSSFAKDKIDLKKTLLKTLLKKQLVNFNDIQNIVDESNLELQSLRKQVKAASFELSSKISKKYPSLDLNANGLPQYLYSKSFNNKSIDTKTSQYQINPSINLRWDIIDPQRGLEIKSARSRFEIAKNNYEIKKNDLIQEAKSRFHKYQKSLEDEKNFQIAIKLSEKSLKDAQAKLEAGIGTKFEVLEANSQLARDKQRFKEKTIAKEINLISLKEIFNIELSEDIFINDEQKLIGFWVHPLKDNLKSGINNSYSLRNITLQNSIKRDEAQKIKNANLPIIFLSNSLSSSFSKGSTLTENIDPNKSSSTYSNKISLNFSWNIFNGGQNKNISQALKAEADAEKFNYLNLQNIIKKKYK